YCPSKTRCARALISALRGDVFPGQPDVISLHGRQLFTVLLQCLPEPRSTKAEPHRVMTGTVKSGRMTGGHYKRRLPKIQARIRTFTFRRGVLTSILAERSFRGTRDRKSTRLNS